MVRSGKVRAMAEECVRRLRIRLSDVGQSAVELSGGNQQKVVLSKWLGCEAEVLIFDEPTRGIDVPSKIELYRVMNRLTARGAAILMISSELPEVCAMSDRVLVMREGAIVAELSRRQATPQERAGSRPGHGRASARLGPVIRTGREFGTVGGLVLLCLTLWILTPHFLTVSNLLNVAQQTCINAIIAVGMTYVIISAGIDLSGVWARSWRSRASCWAALWAPAFLLLSPS